MRSVTPTTRGSAALPGGGGTMRLATGSSLVDDLKDTLLEPAGSSLSVSFRALVRISIDDGGGGVVVVVVAPGLVVLVVVVPPAGTLAGSAGSLPASSSSRSKKPSSSRSMPMRMPLPGGTQV